MDKPKKKPSKKRMFTCSMGEKVDLNDPKTYHMYPNDCKKIQDMYFRELGKDLWYMDYCPDRKDGFPHQKSKKRKMTKLPNGKMYNVNNCGYDQRQRIYILIEKFSLGREKNWDNIMWWKEHLFLLQNETDNFC